MPARNTDPLSVRVPSGYALHGQFRHLLLLAILLPGAWAVAGDALGDGQWLGLSERTWFALALGVPIVQQVAVVLAWRGQLCASLLTRWFGDRGFLVWGVVFFPLLFARPLSLIGIAMADAGRS